MTYAEKLAVKQKRNEELFADRKRGMTFEQLAKKYNVTNQRAQAIVKTVTKYMVTKNDSQA